LFTDVTRDMRIAREEIFGPVVTVTRCEHAIETLREFSYTKMVRFPSGLGTIPSWRAVDDIFDATTGTGATAA
jgi:hypothetical protein